jgi:O-antigen/teichoic acid export membrane protein
VSVVRGRSAGSQRVRLLVMGKLADQGSLFLGSLLVARAVGPAAFAPLGVLLIVNSMSVQLSDLGLGFAVHGSPIDAPVPGRSLRTMRRVGLVALVGSCVAATLTGSALVAAGGAIWWLSADAYVRKATMVRAHRARRVFSAEALGAVAFLAGAAVAVAADVPELLGAGLVLKHLVECLAMPLQGAVDPAGHLPSHQEWFGQMATFAASNADYVVVMLLLPPAAFSIYVMAFRLANALPALVGQALTQDTFVELASSPGGGRDAAVMAGVRRRVVRLSVVGAAGGIAAALVGRAVLGPEWADLVVVAAVLVLAMPARLLLGPSVAMALARDRPRRVVETELLRLTLTATAVAVGSRWGVTGCAVGAVVGTTLGTALLHASVAMPPSSRPGTGSYSAQSQ